MRAGDDDVKRGTAWSASAWLGPVPGIAGWSRRSVRDSLAVQLAHTRTEVGCPTSASRGGPPCGAAAPCRRGRSCHDAARLHTADTRGRNPATNRERCRRDRGYRARSARTGHGGRTLWPSLHGNVANRRRIRRCVENVGVGRVRHRGHALRATCCLQKRGRRYLPVLADKQLASPRGRRGADANDGLAVPCLKPVAPNPAASGMTDPAGVGQAAGADVARAKSAYWLG